MQKHINEQENKKCIEKQSKWKPYNVLAKINFIDSEGYPPDRDDTHHLSKHNSFDNAMALFGNITLKFIP